MRFPIIAGVLSAVALAGCGRSALLEFDNGCPPDDPQCGRRFSNGTDDLIFGSDDDGGGSGRDDGGGLADGDNGNGDGNNGNGDGNNGNGDGSNGNGDGNGGNGDGGGGHGDGGGGNGDGGGGHGDGGGGNGDGGGGNGDGGGGDGGGCVAKEVCGNKIDDNCNGLTDCFDPACLKDSSCIDMKTEICNNGLDDDNNGLVDCKDPQCFGDVHCIMIGHEICNNGLDDNDDGLIDCKDPTCINDPICQPVMGNEICNNGLDDNANGLVDCADPACAAFPACLHAACMPTVDFGTIQPHDALVTKTMVTAGSKETYNTCAAPGGTALVGEFINAAAADVRLDFTQAQGTAHVVELFRAGNLQACDANPVFCLNAGQMAKATHTFAGLPAGTYRVIVQSFPGTQGSTTVTLSTGSSQKMEICNNGVDDDMNGLVDCADLACKNDQNCVNKQCNPDINLGALIVGDPGKVADFDTAQSTNRYHPTCAGISTGKDEVVRFTLKETAGILVVWTQTGDHVFGLFTTPPAGLACDTNQISCFNPGGGGGGQVAYQPKPPGDYVFIFKPIAAGAEGKMHVVISALGNRMIEICNNGIDDDANGLVDCNDPGCFGVGNCKAPLCMPDNDLGDFDYGTQQTVVLDVAKGQDLYTTRCGKGNGKERVVRVNLLKPMALGFNCNESGDQILQLDEQVNPLDQCNQDLLVCADPKIIPFGCNFAIPNLQPGKYNVIVEAFQAGTEGKVTLTLFGIQERVLENCTNGVDDDNDGFTDCADKKCVLDPQCAMFACRADKRLGVLPLDGSMTSTVLQTQGNGDNQAMTPCVSAAGGEDGVVDFELPAKADLTIEWAQVGDHAFALFQDSNDLLACEANPIVDCHASMGAQTGMYTLSKVPQGKYHLVVDADKAGKSGGAVLQLFGMPSM